MELKLFEVLDLNMDLHLHECFWDGLRINYCEILCDFTITSRFFCNVIVNTTRACDWPILFLLIKLERKIFRRKNID